MAAVIYQRNGAGEDLTDKTGGTLWFCKADTAAPSGVGEYLTVPTAGNTTYSYEIYVRPYFFSYTSATNLCVYTDGSNSFGTGEAVFAKTVSSYATPVQATSTTGYTLITSYTSASPLSLGAGPYTGTGDKGAYLKLIGMVDDTCLGNSDGSQSEGLTFSWDEI